jgi:quercetin dioxygenase-like cupin family protein
MQPSRKELLQAVFEGARSITNVRVHEIHFPPGQKGGLHYHPGPVTGYILRGVAELEVEGETPQVLPAGSAFYEPAEKRIRRFDNQSDSEEMVFLAFYLLDGDQSIIEMLDR